MGLHIPLFVNQLQARMQMLFVWLLATLDVHHVAEGYGGFRLRGLRSRGSLVGRPAGRLAIGSACASFGR